jgi:crotonobetainyl-CoA:carnitine CoA-transferase CaiB-like acyl-CoA transferase
VRRADFFREARGDLSGPLADLHVVELTTTWAGPMAGCLLADLGADVIKVEHPRGEMARRAPPLLPGTDTPVSFMHATVNRNKRSLTLDLHDARAREILLRLVARSDVVIENFRPGALDAFGLGFGELRAMKHDLVLVSVSGFGQYGPMHQRAGYDPLAQAESGWMSLNGEPGGMPTKAPTFLADDLAGLHAAIATLAALHHRDLSGEGQHIDVALLDSLLFQSNGYLTLGALGDELPRLGNQFRIAAPANTYRCRDGLVAAGVLIDAHWKQLARVVGRPELADDAGYATTPARLTRRETVDKLLRDWLAERSMDEAEQALLGAGLPFGRVRSYGEAARNPHVRERDMLQDTAVEGGRVPLTGPAAKFSRTPTRIRVGPPALGEHTDAILEELGVAAEERAQLRADGVI